MNKSELAQKMLQWEQLQREADDLAAEIKETVLGLGETIEVGNVRARYSGGRRSFDYEAAAKPAALPEQVERHTVTIVKTDWRTIALEELGLDKETQIPFRKSNPSVSLLLEG